MNLFFKYKSLIELDRQYSEVFDVFLEDGEFSEELQNKLWEIESDSEKLLWDVLNIQDELIAHKNSNKQRIQNLKDKNDSVDKQVEFLDNFIQQIVKKNNTRVKSGNYNSKVGERSITLAQRESAEISEEFDNKDYTTYQLKSKIPIEHAERIKNYLSQRELPVELEKSIDKRQVLNDLKEGKVIENAELKSTPYLIKK